MNTKLIPAVFGKVPEKYVFPVISMLVGVALLCSFSVIFTKSTDFQLATGVIATLAMVVWSRIAQAARVIQAVFSVMALLSLVALGLLIVRSA